MFPSQLDFQNAFRRHALSGSAPVASESLLIAGLLVALVEQIGGQGALHWNRGKPGAAGF
jgi:hypothetical protein